MEIEWKEVTNKKGKKIRTEGYLGHLKVFDILGTNEFLLFSDVFNPHYRRIYRHPGWGHFKKEAYAKKAAARIVDHFMEETGLALYVVATRVS